MPTFIYLTNLLQLVEEPPVLLLLKVLTNLSDLKAFYYPQTNDIPGENTQVVNGDRLKIDSRRRSQVRLLLLASGREVGCFSLLFIAFVLFLLRFGVLPKRILLAMNADTDADSKNFFAGNQRPLPFFLY